MDDEDQADGGYTDADIQGRTPMARFARPEDIARAVAFLADPPPERLRQRAHPIRGRRLVRRRLLGEPSSREAGPVVGAQTWTA
jgi:NAD(P)-dependent dehydrogenase (short-subunit alcohol dehydrogenase family)